VAEEREFLARHRAIQTVGTVAAGLIIALVAIFAGVGYTSAIRYFVILGLLMVTSFATFLWLGVLLAKWTTKKISAHLTGLELSRDLLFPLSLGCVITTAWALSALTATYLRDDSARWTGYIA
jgi:hypothetical protein